MNISEFKQAYLSSVEFIEVKTSGSTGSSKLYQVEKGRMKSSALRTNEFFGLHAGSKVGLCMSVEFIGGKMMVVRAIEGVLDLVELPVNKDPLKEFEDELDFIAMVPYQFKASALEDLKKCKKILLGGAMVDQECLEKINQLDGVQVYESFGMTETLSHFAVKNLSFHENTFQCLDNVNIGLDDRGCLWVEVEGVTEERVQTNDLVQIEEDQRFKWLGRYDFMVNSAGVKIIPEEIEAFLMKCSAGISTRRFFLGGVEDGVLGQKLVLVVEGDEFEMESELNEIESEFGIYKVPKQVVFCSAFKELGSGKVDRRGILNGLK